MTEHIEKEPKPSNATKVYGELLDSYKAALDKYHAGENISAELCRIGNMALACLEASFPTRPEEDDDFDVLWLITEFLLLNCLQSYLFPSTHDTSNELWEDFYSEEITHRVLEAWTLMSALNYRFYSQRDHALIISLKIKSLRLLNLRPDKTTLWPYPTNTISQLLIEKADEYHQQNKFQEAAEIYEIFAQDLTKQNSDAEFRKSLSEAREHEYDYYATGDIFNSYHSNKLGSLLNDLRNPRLLENYGYLSHTYQMKLLVNAEALAIRAGIHRLSEYYRHGIGAERNFEKAAIYRKLLITNFKESYLVSFDEVRKNDEKNTVKRQKSKGFTEKEAKEVTAHIFGYRGKTFIDSVFYAKTRFELSVWFRAKGRGVKKIFSKAADVNSPAPNTQYLNKYEECFHQELIFDELISAEEIFRQLPDELSLKEYDESRYREEEYGLEDTIGKNLNFYYTLAKDGDIEVIFAMVDYLRSVFFLMDMNSNCDRQALSVFDEKLFDQTSREKESILTSAEKKRKETMKYFSTNRDEIIMELLLTAAGTDYKELNYSPHPKAIYMLGEIALKKGNRDEARVYWRDLLDNIEDYPANDFVDIFAKAIKKLIPLEKEIAEERAARDVEKKLYSYLSHTITSSIATGPMTIRGISRTLKKEFGDDKIPDSIIEALGSIKSNYEYTETLINTFQNLVTKPQELKEKWDSDNLGDANIKWLLAVSLKQVVAEVVFNERMSATLEKLSENYSPEDVRKSFFSEFLDRDIDSNNYDELYSWSEKYFPVLDINLDASALEYCFHIRQTRFGILFATFSELLLNALKYGSFDKKIRVQWAETENMHTFQITNSVDNSSMSDIERGGNGLEFIKTIFDKTNTIDFTYGFSSEDNTYHAALNFSK